MDLAGGFPPFPSFYYPVYWHLLSSHVPWNRVVPVCACRVFVFSFRCVVPFFPFPFFLFPFFSRGNSRGRKGRTDQLRTSDLNWSSGFAKQCKGEEEVRRREPELAEEVSQHFPSVMLQ